jgi:hypothetical protein
MRRLLQARRAPYCPGLAAASTTHPRSTCVATARLCGITPGAPIGGCEPPQAAPDPRSAWRRSARVRQAASFARVGRFNRARSRDRSQCRSAVLSSLARGMHSLPRARPRTNSGAMALVRFASFGTHRRASRGNLADQRHAQLSFRVLGVRGAPRAARTWL